MGNFVMELWAFMKAHNSITKSLIRTSVHKHRFKTDISYGNGAVEIGPLCRSYSI